MPPQIGKIISSAVYNGKLKSNPSHQITSDTISCYFVNVPQGRESRAGEKSFKVCLLSLEISSRLLIWL